MESCKHINALNLPYSGKLCNECKSILIDENFDKNLTKKRFNDIMEVLAQNYNGNTLENPKWVYSYEFVVTKKTKETAEEKRDRENREEEESIEEDCRCQREFETGVEETTPTESLCCHLIEKCKNAIIFCVKCGEVFEYEPPRRKESVQVIEFRKIIYEFQGSYDETVEKIPDELYEELSEKFPDRKVTKPQLRNALKNQKKYQRFIKVVHWIHHIFTGVPKNDINKHMKELIEDFEYLCIMFRDLKKIPFDPQLILCVLLDSYDCDHDRSEFHFKNYTESKEEKLVEAISN